MAHARLRRQLLALPLPLAMLWAGLDFLDARGPFWLGTNSDPSYVYLLNSLLVIEGEAPVHLDHPGSTVHALGAIVVSGAHALGARPSPLPDDLLRDPEWYAHAIAVVFLSLYTATMVLAGTLLLRATDRLSLTWMLQATPFFSPSCLFELTDVKPEPLLFVVAGLLAATVAASLARCEQAKGWLAIGLGILTGAAVASKFTAVSLCAVPLLALSGGRRRFTWLASSAASFLLVTFPAWSQWRQASSFLWQLARGSGLYGHALFAQSVRYGDGLRRVLVEEAPFFAVLLSGLGAAFLARRRQKADAATAARREALRMLWALLAAGLTQVALALKHPYQPRYLLPALGLTGLILALSTWLTCWDEHGRADPRARAAIVCLTALVALLQLPRFVRRRAQVREAALCQLQARRSAEAAAAEGCPLLSFYRASSLPLALHQGDAWTRHAFAERLARLYTSDLFVTVQGRVSGFQVSAGPFAIGPGDCVVLQGSPGGPGRPFAPLSDFRPPDFAAQGRREVRFACPWEAVTRIEGIGSPAGQASDSIGSPLRMGSSP